MHREARKIRKSDDTIRSSWFLSQTLLEFAFSDSGWNLNRPKQMLHICVMLMMISISADEGVARVTTIYELLSLAKIQNNSIMSRNSRCTIKSEFASSDVRPPIPYQ